MTQEQQGYKEKMQQNRPKIPKQFRTVSAVDGDGDENKEYFLRSSIQNNFDQPNLSNVFDLQFHPIPATVEKKSFSNAKLGNTSQISKKAYPISSTLTLSQNSRYSTQIPRTHRAAFQNDEEKAQEELRLFSPLKTGKLKLNFKNAKSINNLRMMTHRNFSKNMFRKPS